MLDERHDHEFWDCILHHALAAIVVDGQASESEGSSLTHEELFILEEVLQVRESVIEKLTANS